MVRRLMLIAAVAALGLAGCTSTSSPPTSSTTPVVAVSDPSTSATLAIPSSPPVASTPSTPPSSSASAATVPPTTKSSAATTHPWPANFTAAQQKMAQTALDTYHQSWAVLDKANAQPGKDWTATIDKYVADPRRSQILSSLKALAAQKLHGTGSTKVQATVTSILGSGDGARVTVQACIDSSGTDLLNAAGKSVKAALPVGPRIKQSANVYKYAEKDGGWLLSEVTVPQPYQAC